MYAPLEPAVPLVVLPVVYSVPSSEFPAVPSGPHSPLTVVDKLKSRPDNDESATLKRYTLSVNTVSTVPKNKSSVPPDSVNVNSFTAAPIPPVEIVPVADPDDDTLSPAANSAPDPLIVEGPI